MTILLESLTERTFSFDFVGKRIPAFVITALLVAATFAAIPTRGLNFGIDFLGGVLIDAQFPEKVDMKELRDKLGSLKLDEINIQSVGTEGNEVLIHALGKGLNEKEQGTVAGKIKELLGDTVDYKKTEIVGPKVGGELITNSIIASILAILTVALYIWFRFEWRFSLGILLALVIDISLTVGIFSFFWIEFDMSTVAALMMLAGYSANDKVVTYDRVRENLKKYRKMPLPELINKSANEVLMRTLLTGVTVMLAVLSLYIWGGDVLRGLSIAIMAGCIIGTYTSLFIAMPLLKYMDIRGDGMSHLSIDPYAGREVAGGKKKKDKENQDDSECSCPEGECFCGGKKK